MRALIASSVVVAGMVMAVAEETNLTEVLRRFQRELDLQSQAAKEAVRPAKPREAAVPAGEVKPAASVPKPPQLPAATSVVPVLATNRAAESVGAEYQFKEGDVVSVEVEGEPDMSLARGVVGGDGAVTLPMVGATGFRGRTVNEVQAHVLAVLAKDYLVDPKVKVRVLEPSRCTFTILQNVAKPGAYEWSGKERMTLWRAIGMAGGATRSAALSRVTVRRRTGGKEVTLKVDLEAANRNPGAAPFYLQSGDVVEVGGAGKDR